MFDRLKKIWGGKTNTVNTAPIANSASTEPTTTQIEPQPAPSTITTPPEDTIPLTPNKNVVLIVSSFSGGNDVVHAINQQYKQLFDEAGFSVQIIAIDFTDQENASIKIEDLFEIIASGCVYCAISFAGGMYGFNIDVDGEQKNVWSYYKIPFICIWGDHPSYYIDTKNITTLNVIHSQTSKEFSIDHQKLLPNLNSTHIHVSSIPFSSKTLHSNIDFKSKKSNTLYFIKNGNCPNRLISLWQDTLNPAIATTLRTLADYVLPITLQQQQFSWVDVIQQFFGEQKKTIGQF
jgi:hypothetical protein